MLESPLEEVRASYRIQETDVTTQAGSHKDARQREHGNVPERCQRDHRSARDNVDSNPEDLIVLMVLQSLPKDYQ